ncbi:Aldehyde/histidinol dehydrogenase [Aspergillus karnatakaensis]|uniref:Aldehyde/histidinol dehydrogenase n=1 Tax=Aspergillus karnatakaensis TaxID=1810916 RepID=UPI003CCCB6F5
MAQSDSQNTTGSPEPIETRLFINGEFQPSSDGKTFDSINPFTREPVAQVSQATEEDVNKAVAAAKAAFPAWRDLSPADRGAYLHRLAALIRKAIPEFARLESLSTGKPVSRYIDGNAAAESFSYFAEAGWTVQGTSSLNTPGHFNMTVKQPYGVVACIIPWNVPMAFFAFKAAPALAAGNTGCPQEQREGTFDTGFPPGVINVVSGFGTPTGSALASHMDVRCLSFTGSSFTGQKIQTAAAASNMKVVHMELGGKSPALIFDDADLKTCMANSRIYVQETVAEKFLALFKDKYGAATLGNPLEPGTSHGPQVDGMQYERVKSYLAIGEKDGKLSMGGDGDDGYFIKPTVFQDVPEDSRLVKEEVFGPVVVINTFKREEEAIEKANASELGLYASVFTKDLDRAVRTSKLLEAGTVGVNCTSPSTAKDMPFGGYKMSGIGREGFMHSLDSFLETKTILIKMSS